MRMLFLSILVLITGARVAAEPKSDGSEEINILFIGNSFTAWNELPQLVKQVAEEGNPGLTVNVEKVIGGGQSMFTHWNYFKSHTYLEMSTVSDETIRQRIAHMRELEALDELPIEYTNYPDSIGRNGRMPPLQNFKNVLGWSIKRLERLLDRNPRTKWDYVVLQSWVDETADPEKGYAEWATKFADLAAEHDTEVILYITAPFVQNAEPVQGPRLQQQVDLQMQAARSLAEKIDPFAVVPVPLAINMIQQDGTDLTFCFENDFHPNQTTSYLTANMFYAAMFGDSTEGFVFDTVTCTKLDGDGKDPDGGEATVVFNDDTRAYLQRTAFDAVRAFNQSIPHVTSVEKP